MLLQRAPFIYPFFIHAQLIICPCLTKLNFSIRTHGPSQTPSSNTSSYKTARPTSLNPKNIPTKTPTINLIPSVKTLISITPKHSPPNKNQISDSKASSKYLPQPAKYQARQQKQPNHQLIFSKLHLHKNLDKARKETNTLRKRNISKKNHKNFSVILSTNKNCLHFVLNT